MSLYTSGVLMRERGGSHEVYPREAFHPIDQAVARQIVAEFRQRASTPK
jgi:hypothetical protein